MTQTFLAVISSRVAIRGEVREWRIATGGECDHSHDMKFRPILVIVSLVCTGVLGAVEPIKVLFFTKAAGYEHQAIKRGPAGEPSHAEQVLSELGATNAIEFSFSKDGSLFSPDYLKQFDVVFFYTSGNLMAVGNDGNPPMSGAGKQALLEWVAAGGGFMAAHAGSDTFHTYEVTGGNPPQSERNNRYRLNGEASDPYIKMLGGEFINHGPQQVATALVVTNKFPGFESVGAEITVKEEWYSLKEFSPSNHVLLVMRTAGMEGKPYQRADYPLAWAKPYGNGRVWFNAMGHRDDVWDADYFKAMLEGAFRWTAGRVDAVIHPNVTEVTPQADQLPPQ